MAIRGVGNVGEGVPGQGIGVVAVNGPIDAAPGKRTENSGAGEPFRLVVHVSLRSGRAGEGAIGQGFRGHRTEPAVANGVAARQAGQHR